jgi:hypothetical protein
LVKTHKPGPELKIRPIVSSRGGPTERISWLLTTILSPLLRGIPTHMPDSDHLMRAVLAAPPRDRLQHQHQCSFDVEALYTSVPREDALAVVREKLATAATPAPLEAGDVIELLRAVFTLTFFHFDGRIYQQIAGLPMGCAVSGITAIIFLERIETRALAAFAHCSLFLRYVDDCYALVSGAAEACELRDLLNAQHPSIRFDLEHCERHHGTTSLSLLDLTIRVDGEGQASFDFYAKEAKRGLFIHKDSALPWSQKAAAVRNERRRIAHRSSDTAGINLAAFNGRLRSSGYTSRDLQRLEPTHRRRARRTDRPENAARYIDLPFLGEGAERRIRNAFHDEGINIRLYRRSWTLTDVLRPRQREPRRCIWPTCPTRGTTTSCFARNCVYEVTCTPCGRQYIGSTTRPLHERQDLGE